MGFCFIASLPTFVIVYVLGEFVIVELLYETQGGGGKGKENDSQQQYQNSLYMCR
jgi:hypothetical protein